MASRPGDDTPALFTSPNHGVTKVIAASEAHRGGARRCHVPEGLLLPRRTDYQQGGSAADQHFTVGFGGTGKYRMVTVVGNNIQIRGDSSANIRLAVNGMAFAENEVGVRSTARYLAGTTSRP